MPYANNVVPSHYDQHAQRSTGKIKI